VLVRRYVELDLTVGLVLGGERALVVDRDKSRRFLELSLRSPASLPDGDQSPSKVVEDDRSVLPSLVHAFRKAWQTSVGSSPRLGRPAARDCKG
jgi:hypothetical protein